MDAFPYSDAMVEMMAQPVVRLVYAAELEFKDGPARAHTGIGPLVIDGKTFTGVGSLGNVGEVVDQGDSSSAGSVTLTLSGWDNDVVKDTLQDRCRDRPGRLYLVAIDDDGELVADILYEGLMDAADLQYGGNGEDNAISVKITDQMVLWQRKGVEVWSDNSHRARHGGDRLLYAVAQLANWAIYWGAKKDSPGFKYT
ncbi:hypothetical protein P3W43_01515 [Salinicola salarius]|uniref:hypothetical protein n=1 Tax=Salinicola salarius TaxID=430457 RepID=UPI0023E3BE13|nr:hypothetical protein [Salinicola salarius]MDF3917527.1 hypothetical protein [Salinicola salarius]